MTPTAATAAGVEIGVLRGAIVNDGSSWAAFQLALKTRPQSLRDLLALAHVYELGSPAREKAFDAHRVGDHASNDPETRRRCVHPLDLDGKLVLLSEDGICRIGGPDVQVGVSVWTSDRRKGTRPWDAPVRAAEAAGGVSGA